ncbi:MAG: dihydropteroate synthase [bacterium]|nr:dihydropteroate synthase [bacterium]
MDPLFIVPLAPAPAAIAHLKTWFGATETPPIDQPLGLILGRAASPPKGWEALKNRWPNWTFFKAPYLALAFSWTHWPQLAQALAEETPAWFEQIQGLLVPQEAPRFWLRGTVFEPGRPLVMGILNLTPDSFSDGGLYQALPNALARAEEMVAQGADLLDLGGESTRPGSEPVGAEEELARVLPVLKALRQRYPELPLSVDTVKPQVARTVLAAGADLINDVSGLSGGVEMVDAVVGAGAGYVLMHTQGTPKTMQLDPSYGNPVVDVYAFLEERLAFCMDHGLSRDRILVDPGIGFGKRLDHNLELLRHQAAFNALGCWVLLGTSNKSFLEKALGLRLDERAEANLAGQVLGFERGAGVFRVHEVLQTRRALDLARLYRPLGST